MLIGCQLGSPRPLTRAEATLPTPTPLTPGPQLRLSSQDGYYTLWAYVGRTHGTDASVAASAVEQQSVPKRHAHLGAPSRQSRNTRNARISDERFRR
jgi:hypothetical protein